MAGIKPGYPVGNLPKFKADGSAFDWAKFPIADSADLPIAYPTGNANPFFVPRVVILDATLGIDMSSAADIIRLKGISVGFADPVPAPQNIDDPMNPWSRALLSATPQAADTTARPSEQYIGGRLVVVCRRLAGGSYVQAGGSYRTVDKADSRPLCDALPPTGGGNHFTGGTAAIHTDTTADVLFGDRIAGDSDDLVAIADRFDRFRIYFVKGPPGETTTTTQVESVTCRADDEAGTTVFLDGPVITTVDGDADYYARNVDDKVFGSFSSDSILYVDDPPSAQDIIDFFIFP